MHPLEKLTHGLESFVTGDEQSVLLLTTTDVEVPLVVRVLESLDERSPADGDAGRDDADDRRCGLRGSGGPPRAPRSR